MNYGRQIKFGPYPHLLFLPDGGAGGGDAGGGGVGSGDGGAGAPGAQSGGAGAAGSSAGGAAGDQGGTSADDVGKDGKPGDRPAWLPEKFKTPEDFATSYKELERVQFQRRDALKAEARKEIEAERLSVVPKSPGDYQFEPIKLPDGREIKLNDTDPLVPWFQDRAHKMGLSQEQYSELVKDFIQQDMRRGPSWENEVAQLGVDPEQAEMRLKRIEGWMRGNAPQEIYNAFAGIPATASMIKLFEHVMTLSGEPSIKLDDVSSYSAQVTPDSLRQMMADPKYWRDKDPIFVKQVRAAARKLAGE